MRASFVKSLGVAAIAFAAAGPAFAQCAFESAKSHTTVTAGVVNGLVPTRNVESFERSTSRCAAASPRHLHAYTRHAHDSDQR